MGAYTNIGRRLELVAQLLDHEAHTGRGLGVVSVATRAGREKSQISRGLAALEAEALVTRDDETLEFGVGAALLSLAARAGTPALLRRAVPVLERLAAEQGERADLNVLHDGQVLTVESVPSASTVQSVGWTGRRTPVHCTAAGRVLTCRLGVDDLVAIVGPDPLPVAGPRSPGDLAELIRRLDDTRAAGWAVADGELDADVMAVAAPVRDRLGATVAAITVAGPTVRVRSRIDELAAAVRAAAAAASDTGDDTDDDTDAPGG
ncbi:MAG: IclR family transcriptional regulator [Ilumatobacteraceae bacterium]